MIYVSVFRPPFCCHRVALSPEWRSALLFHASKWFRMPSSVSIYGPEISYFVFYDALRCTNGTEKFNLMKASSTLRVFRPTPSPSEFLPLRLFTPINSASNAPWIMVIVMLRSKFVSIIQTKRTWNNDFPALRGEQVITLWSCSGGGETTGWGVQRFKRDSNMTTRWEKCSWLSRVFNERPH